MEVTVGIKNVAREVSVEVNETGAQISQLVETALREKTTLELTGKDGRVVLIPHKAIAYVQCQDATARRVGFGF